MTEIKKNSEGSVSDVCNSMISNVNKEDGLTPLKLSKSTTKEKLKKKKKKKKCFSVVVFC